MARYFDFFDEFLVEIRGDRGRSAPQLREMFSHFAVSDPGREPDMTCEVSTDQPDPDTVLGKPERHYGRDGDRFVVRSGSRFMTATADWDHIEMAPGWEPYHTAYVIEFEVRRRLAEDDLGLIHAAGVEFDGRTILFPAWRSAGKTNTLMSLLRAGGNYLSDDRLWLGADGSVRGYPIPVNLHPHNVESFPELRSDDVEDRLRARVYDLVDDLVDRDRSFVDEAVYFLNEFYLKDTEREFVPLSRLSPGAGYTDRAEVDDVVVLRAAPNADHVAVREIPAWDALTEVSTIGFYEWNRRLTEYFTAFDTLFAGRSRAEELEALIEGEERAFAEAFEEAGIYRAEVPRVDDWERTGVGDELVAEMRRLGERAEVPEHDAPSHD